MCRITTAAWIFTFWRIISSIVGDHRSRRFSFVPRVFRPASFSRGASQDTLPGCGVNGVVKSRSKGRNTRLSHASRRSIALDNVNASVFRSAVHADQFIVVEVALVHDSIGNTNFAHEGKACPKAGCSFHLVADIVGRHNCSGIDRCPDIGNADLTFSIDFDFHYRGHVSEESAVRSDTESMSVPAGTLSPS